jgi:pyruvate/2-oxoglutarate dehydrogenase complex dihydrolipoamide acyltransferase (E2) component
VEEIFVPALGMAMSEAVLLAWLKQPGDAVEAGEAIAEVETDKSVLEISASAAGRLGAHRVAAGDSVAVGATVTVVLADGESEPAPSGPSAADGTAAVAGTAAATAPVAAAPSPPAATAGDGPPSDLPPGRTPHRASPRQRRLAALAEQAASPAAAGSWPADPQDSSRRAPVARQVSRSWSEIPHFAVAREIAADGVTDRLAGEMPAGEVRLTVTDVLIRALGRSLARYGSSDVGLAVATRQGVLIPVLPDVAGRKLSEIAALRHSAAERARNRRSTDEDARTPLVTLSNLGTHGVEWFTGIIPLGQRGLLTTGTLAQRPVVKDGRLSVAWRLTAILNVDHRVWDGLDAAELLSDFDDQIAAYGGYNDGE